MEAVGEYVMSWPILLPREMTVADMLEQAGIDLEAAFDAEGVEQAGPVTWQIGVQRGRLTFTAKVPVAPHGPAVDEVLVQRVDESRVAG